MKNDSHSQRVEVNMAFKDSLPYRAVRYGFRLPSLLYTRFVTQPQVDRWLKGSELDLYVHDPKRGLLRPVTRSERLKWTMREGLACDAVHWLDRVEPLLSTNDVVFDVGANIGTVANWFSERTAIVHAFEPHPDNIEIITRQNKLRRTKNISLYPYALGREEATMQLYVKGFHGHHSLGDAANSPTVNKMDVDVKTIDGFCDEQGLTRIDFLKIDVEGFEEDVLIGAAKMLDSQGIGVVLFEIREVILTSVGRSTASVFAPLLSNGYSVIDLDGHILSGEELVKPVDGDYLAAVDAEDVAKRLADSDLQFI